MTEWRLRHWWLYCSCGWQTKKHNTAMNPVCPECRKQLNVVNFGAAWDKYSTALLAGTTRVVDIEDEFETV